MSESEKPEEEKVKTQDHFLRIYRSRKEMMFNNFLGGIAWALGALFGAGIVIAIVSFVASKIDFIPIIGNWVMQISEFVKQHQTSNLR
jgi:hypothetical protein